MVKKMNKVKLTVLVVLVAISIFLTPLVKERAEGQWGQIFILDF